MCVCVCVCVRARVLVHASVQAVQQMELRWYVNRHQSFVMSYMQSSWLCVAVAYSKLLTLEFGWLAAT
jgi:hypothetical protein